MPRVDVVRTDAPLGERLLAGLAYPLRGAALAACTAMALAHCLAQLPGVGFLLGMAAWLATWRYAADCLRHSAEGYAQPPELMSEWNSSASWMLACAHVLAMLACLACAWRMPRLLPLAMLLSILLLPAIDMLAAFDSSWPEALSPLAWLRVVARFGFAYLLPVAINLVIGLMLLLGHWLADRLPWPLSLPIPGFVLTYLILLDFHLMGMLIHRRHDDFGVAPEAEMLAHLKGEDADERLLDEVSALERQHQFDAAIALLVQRMQHRSAPAQLHLAYRHLLRARDYRDGLLEHGHLWIAALIAEREPRRALGVLQECREIDPAFLPDASATVGELAELAERLGIARLSLHLCEGYLAHWPRDAQALSYGLLAVRLLAGPLGQPDEARSLLQKLLAVYGHAAEQRAAIDALALHMTSLPRPT